MKRERRAERSLGTQIGEIVYAEMARRGWSQGQLAAKATLSQPVISALVAGRTVDPRSETLLKICAAFGWSPGALLDLSASVRPQAPGDGMAQHSRATVPEGPTAEAFRLLRGEVRLAMETAQKAQAAAEEAKRLAEHRGRKSA